MTVVPLTHLAVLNAERHREDPAPLLTLDLIESGTGRLLADCWGEEREPPAIGVADVRTGDVLFGKLRPYLAKVLLAQRRAYASTELLCLRPRTGVNPAWFFYRMSSKPVIDWAVATSDGTKMPRTSWERLGTFATRIPSLLEQRAVADYLDLETARVDTLIARRREQSRLLDERASRRVNDIFGVQQVTIRDGVPVGIHGSDCVRLGYLASLQTGLTLDAQRITGEDAVTLPYLRVANVQDGHLNLDRLTEVSVPKSLAARCRLRAGDVLMTEGGDPDKLGRGTVWAGEVDPCLHQNHIFAVRPDAKRLLPSYLALVTRTHYARRYFEVTATKTTGIASTSTGKIAAFRIPVPDIAEQRRIVDLHDAASADVDRLRRHLVLQVSLLQERRQALITAAVTGNINVPGAAA